MKGYNNLNEEMEKIIFMTSVLQLLLAGFKYTEHTHMFEALSQSDFVKNLCEGERTFATPTYNFKINASRSKILGSFEIILPTTLTNVEKDQKGLVLWKLSQNISYVGDVSEKSLSLIKNNQLPSLIKTLGKKTEHHYMTIRWVPKDCAVFDEKIEINDAAILYSTDTIPAHLLLGMKKDEMEKNLDEKEQELLTCFPCEYKKIAVRRLGSIGCELNEVQEFETEEDEAMEVEIESTCDDFPMPMYTCEPVTLPMENSTGSDMKPTFVWNNPKYLQTKHTLGEKLIWSEMAAQIIVFHK